MASQQDPYHDSHARPHGRDPAYGRKPFRTHELRTRRRGDRGRCAVLEGRARSVGGRDVPALSWEGDSPPPPEDVRSSDMCASFARTVRHARCPFGLALRSTCWWVGSCGLVGEAVTVAVGLGADSGAIDQHGHAIDSRRCGSDARHEHPRRRLRSGSRVGAGVDRSADSESTARADPLRSSWPCFAGAAT